MTTRTFDIRPGSERSTTNPRTLTRDYVAAGFGSRWDVEAHALMSTPLIDNFLWRQNVEVKEVGFQVYYATVSYGTKQPANQTGTFRWAFDATGSTIRVKQAKEHIASYSVVGPWTDTHEGSIDVNANGDPEGCETIVPSFSWTENHKLPLGEYGWSYANAIAALVGTVNNNYFRGKPPYTVLFKGAPGGQSDADPEILDITYQFAYSPNLTGLTFGSVSGIAKKGWEYLWIEYQKSEGATDKNSITIPIAVHVERMYDYADFASLGIGQ